MITKVKKWGNSMAVRLPKGILDEMQIVENDCMECVCEEDAIKLFVSKPQYKSLDQLFLSFEVQPKLKCEECNTGKPVGKEIF